MINEVTIYFIFIHMYVCTYTHVCVYIYLNIEF